nr:MAG: hypothetical protein [Microvirus Sku13]
MKIKENKKKLFTPGEFSYLAALLSEDIHEHERRIDSCIDAGFPVRDEVYQRIFELQDLYNRLIEFLTHE